MFLPSLNTSTEHTLTFTPCLLEVKLQDKTRNMNEGVITLKKTPILAWLVGTGVVTWPRYCAKPLQDGD
jgi:hypothetical protein